MSRAGYHGGDGGRNPGYRRCGSGYTFYNSSYYFYTPGYYCFNPSHYRFNPGHTLYPAGGGCFNRPQDGHTRRRDGGGGRFLCQDNTLRGLSWRFNATGYVR
jgi:hypothetical protein